MLVDPAQRDHAACTLYRLGRWRTKASYTEERCDVEHGAVNHVVVAPQASEPPFYLVFRRWPFPDEHIGPGKPKGPFSIVDGSGRFVPVFGNANMLDEDDDVFAYAGTDARAVAHVIPYGGGEEPAKWTTYVLHIVPVTTRQEAVLSVVLGPSTYGFHCLGSYWTWRHRDLDGDGVPEIEIGPRQDAPIGLLPRAVYRWSAERGAYEGPEGSIASGFLRVYPDPTEDKSGCGGYWNAAERFAQEWRKHSERGDPAAVRKNVCGGGIDMIHF